MKWTHITASCRKKDLDAVCAVMSMIDSGLEIEDYSDVEQNLTAMYGALIDEKILQADKDACKVSFYLSEEADASGAIGFLARRFEEAGIGATLSRELVDDEDWADNWKKYYKPLRIGRHIVVRPPWETCETKKGDVEIVMDPGMAFGTGTHESTRLCLLLLEKNMKKGDRVLDVGTGSGILSIAAVGLGARDAFAYDLDPTAVRVAKENFVANGVSDRVFCATSDLLRSVDRKNAPFDFVCANIVADILIRMAPEIGGYMAHGARLAASGVIDKRRNDVLAAMTAGGLRPIGEETEADWCALLFEKP